MALVKPNMKWWAILPIFMIVFELLLILVWFVEEEGFYNEVCSVFY